VPARSREFTHSLYNVPLVGSVEQLQANMGKTAQKWAFVSEAEDAFQQSDPLILPRIEPFLPSGTDVDAAKSLAALYRSHCTSLVECIRYCKEKTFFHLFTSFQGTLTMPVQKLFSNPVLAPWIEESDFVMYQRMMRIVSNLTLQVVPKPVLDTLRNISERLVRHIRDSFQGQPQHVIRAKEAPATIFASLLDRALRVNLTAHAAANMLANPANRDVMYMEWITLVSPRKVAESIPSKGMDDVVELLVTEMRDILDPVNVPWALEGMTLQGDMAVRTGRQPAPEQMASTNASNVLDRWVAFLRSLPQRFPYASPTDIVWCVQRVGTAVMRDITISQGKSFGSWWVTKCWIDEMIQYLAEQGGFMLQTSTRTIAAESVPPRTAGSSQGASHHSSRYSSGSEDFNLSHVSHMSHMSQSAAPEPQPVPADAVAEAVDGSMGGIDGQANHDDSGIGIRTPDEDVPLDKLVFPTPDARDLFAGTELQSPALA
jgi:regulatory factor X, other